MNTQLNTSINDATWLTEKTRNNLLKVYDNIYYKNVLEDAVDQLEFDPYDTSAYDYKHNIMLVMRLLALKEAHGIIGGSMNGVALMLHRLHDFFDLLCNESFDTMVQIDDIMNNSKRSEQEREEMSYKLVESNI